jgi:preprotein translocase subunit YajC
MDPKSNPIMQLIPFLIIFAIFYFLLIMPMRRRQKKHSEMLTKLTRGDRVVTNGGIFGTVIDVESDKVTLRIAEKVDIQVSLQAIGGLAKDAADVNMTPSEK